MSSVATSEGKKTEQGMMTSTPELPSKVVTVVDPPEGQTPKPPTNEKCSHILTNCKI
jgi:hypothetical protein